MYTLSRRFSLMYVWNVGLVASCASFQLSLRFATLPILLHNTLHIKCVTRATTLRLRALTPRQACCPKFTDNAYQILGLVEGFAADW
jgi:hypothetical protein